MRLMTDFGRWVDTHFDSLEHRPPHLRYQAQTCVDETAQGMDRLKAPVMWQGFIVATPGVRQLLWVIEYVVENVKRRYYPHEGHLSMLYVTGPGALGRAVTARRRCHNASSPEVLGRFRHMACQWGHHGSDLRGNPRSQRFAVR